MQPAANVTNADILMHPTANVTHAGILMHPAANVAHAGILLHPAANVTNAGILLIQPAVKMANYTGCLLKTRDCLNSKWIFGKPSETLVFISVIDAMYPQFSTDSGFSGHSIILLKFGDGDGPNLCRVKK